MHCTPYEKPGSSLNILSSMWMKVPVAKLGKTIMNVMIFLQIKTVPVNFVVNTVLY